MEAPIAQRATSLCLASPRRQRLLPAYEISPIVSPCQTLIGRQQALAMLQACVTHLHTGRGQFVTLEGAAGIGKSRLVAELRHQAGSTVCWLESQALSSTHALSYGPFRDMLCHYAEITSVDDDGQAAQKLADRIGMLAAESAVDILPYLLKLAGIRVRAADENRVKYLTPEALGRQIFHAVFRFIAALASERPLVLLFDNWHRCDIASAALLAHLVPLIHQVPVLICVVSRLQRRPDERWQQLAADRYHHMLLDALSPQESMQFLNGLDPDAVLSEPTRATILAKAKGNPFFLKEMTVACAQSAAAVLEARPDLPDTIESQILVRFHHLPEPLQTLVQLAAVIGYSFDFRLVQDLLQRCPKKLENDLADLQRRHFIDVCQPVAQRYRFKHDLLQEAVYQHLTLAQRQHLHRQVGNSLEAVCADRIEMAASHLAYHYTQAEAWEKARNYLLQAGDLARQVASDAGGVHQYQQVLDRFDDKLAAPQWISLKRKMGEALYQRGAHQQAEVILQQALSKGSRPLPVSRLGMVYALARQGIRHLARQWLPDLGLSTPARADINITQERLLVYEMLVWIAYASGQRARFLLGSLTALNLAERSGCLAEAARSFSGLGTMWDVIAMFRLAHYYHRRAVVLAEQVQHPLTLGLAYFCLGHHEECLGAWDRALAHYRHSADIYQDIGEFRSWGTAMTCLSRIYTQQGSFARSLAESEQLTHIGREGADPLVWGWGLMRKGDNLMRLGDLDDAIDHLRRAAKLMQTVPAYHTLVEVNDLLARCYVRQGRLSEALAVAEWREPHTGQYGLQSSHQRLAEVSLAMAEQASGAARDRALKNAKRACQAALQGSAFSLGGMPRAWRLSGTYAWLQGRTGAAQKRWRKSLHSAERLGAQWELGMTHLEMGMRLHDADHLQRAETALTMLCATLDAARARQYRDQLQDLHRSAGGFSIPLLVR